MTAECDAIRVVLLAKSAALIARNADDLAALIHPDFTYLNASGVTFNKAGYVETYCRSGDIIFDDQQYTGSDITLFVNFAVAMLSISDRFHTQHGEMSARYRSLCVFSKTTDGWLWVAGQTAQYATPSPRVGFMTGQVTVPEDFDTMCQEEIAAMFNGEE